MPSSSFLTPSEQILVDRQRFDSPLRQALAESLAQIGANPASAALDLAALPDFDYQTRSAFAAAKQLGSTPAEAAGELARALGSLLSDRGLGCAEPSAGSGFVNIRLSDRAVLDGMSAPCFPSTPGIRALVDYSSPNCAKRMHVGHLRSTVIGDALCRMMEACGADVERVNHLGDWGTPFGIVIEQALEEGASLALASLPEIEGLYRRGSARMAEHDGPAQGSCSFAARARQATARMQARDPCAIEAWGHIRSATISELQRCYDLLGVSLRPEHAVGESSYQEEAEALVRELVERGICQRGEQGAAYVGSKTPLPLEKSAARGGGLLYGATDAAALRRRGATGRKLLYVTDERQAGHFQALFELGERAGLIAPGQAAHVPFGMMLGKDGAPFKSRSGDPMALSELVDEAAALALRAAREKAPHASEPELAALSARVGASALKYADLARNRSSSVKFDPSQAMALEGDTAAYLQYARARALSAANASAGLEPRERGPGLDERERALALALCRIRDGACDALGAMAPHHLCHALFCAASAFGPFYELCPSAPGGRRDPLRAALMESFARKLREGMEALGVDSFDSMPRAKSRATG